MATRWVLSELRKYGLLVLSDLGGVTLGIVCYACRRRGRSPIDNASAMPRTGATLLYPISAAVNSPSFSERVCRWSGAIPDGFSASMTLPLFDG